MGQSSDYLRAEQLHKFKLLLHKSHKISKNVLKQKAIYKQWVNS